MKDETRIMCDRSWTGSAIWFLRKRILNLRQIFYQGQQTLTSHLSRNLELWCKSNSPHSSNHPRQSASYLSNSLCLCRPSATWPPAHCGWGWRPHLRCVWGAVHWDQGVCSTQEAGMSGQQRCRSAYQCATASITITISRPSDSSCSQFSG